MVTYEGHAWGWNDTDTEVEEAFRHCLGTFNPPFTLSSPGSNRVFLWRSVTGTAGSHRPLFRSSWDGLSSGGTVPSPGGRHRGRVSTRETPRAPGLLRHFTHTGHQFLVEVSLFLVHGNRSG